MIVWLWRSLLDHLNTLSPCSFVQDTKARSGYCCSPAFSNWSRVNATILDLFSHSSGRLLFLFHFISRFVTSSMMMDSQYGQLLGVVLRAWGLTRSNNDRARAPKTYICVQAPTMMSRMGYTNRLLIVLRYFITCVSRYFVHNVCMRVWVVWHSLSPLIYSWFMYKGLQVENTSYCLLDCSTLRSSLDTVKYKTIRKATHPDIGSFHQLWKVNVGNSEGWW